MVFAVARQAGWLTDEVSAEHAAIGLVTGPDGEAAEDQELASRSSSSR